MQNYYLSREQAPLTSAATKAPGIGDDLGQGGDEDGGDRDECPVVELTLAGHQKQ
jgi:hypothetical protein